MNFQIKPCVLALVLLRYFPGKRKKGKRTSMFADQLNEQQIDRLTNRRTDRRDNQRIDQWTDWRPDDQNTNTRTRHYT